MDEVDYKNYVLDFISTRVSTKFCKTITHIFSQLQKQKKLTFTNIWIIILQLLPKSIYNDWEGVNMKLPLDIPSTLTYSTMFCVEWYFAAMNGYGIVDGRKVRLYFVIVFKRIALSKDDPNRLFAAFINIHIVEKNKPPISYNSIDVGLEGTTFTYTTNPLIIRKNGDDLFSFIPQKSNYQLSIHYSDTNLNLDMECVTTKNVLLQGKMLNGLDPSSTQFTSQITGASYMYYSYVNFNLNKGSIDLHNQTYAMDTDSHFNVWLDHQAGVVKSPKKKILSQLSVMLGMRPNLFPGWNWLSFQLFDNTQFTGFANKPWKNKTSYNHQQLQGTWCDSSGKLTWIHGTVHINKFWQSERKTNFGIDYTFDLGSFGTYKVNTITNDQRVMEEGIENYEGGADVFNEKGEMIGFGYVECLGWPDLDNRISFTLDSLSPDLQLKKRHVRILKDTLKFNVSDAVLLIFFVLLCIGLFYVIVMRKRINTIGSGFTHSAVVCLISFVMMVVLFFVVFLLLKKFMCDKSYTCSVNKYNSCMLKCN
jgi:hypothetical protein